MELNVVSARLPAVPSATTSASIFTSNRLSWISSSAPSDRGTVAGGALGGPGGGLPWREAGGWVPGLPGHGETFVSSWARRGRENDPGPPPPRGDAGWATIPDHPI